MRRNLSELLSSRVCMSVFRKLSTYDEIMLDAPLELQTHEQAMAGSGFTSS